MPFFPINTCSVFRPWPGVRLRWVDECVSRRGPERPRVAVSTGDTEGQLSFAESEAAPGFPAARRGRCPTPPRGSGASCRVSRSRPQTGSSPGGLQRASARVLVPAAGGTLLGCCVPPQVWIFWRNKPVFRVSCPFPSSPRETPNACGRVRRPPLLGGPQPVSPRSPAHGRPCPREDRGRERGSRQRFLPRESLWFRAETPARCPLRSLSKTKSVKMRTFQQFIKIPRRGSNRRNYPRCIQSVIS